jgi:hypothetical protein
MDVYVHAAVPHGDGHDGADGDTGQRDGYAHVAALARQRYGYPQSAFVAIAQDDVATVGSNNGARHG